MFDSGADPGNEWHALPQWPPHTLRERLYLAAGGRISLQSPTEKRSFDEYLSDPANPVPYFPNAPQDMAKEYMTADQRFLHDRKDIMSYLTEPLTEDVTIAGPISPDLFVSTTGTDSDFDVKLIDVYPRRCAGLARRLSAVGARRTLSRQVPQKLRQV